jgi:hypothetical protein
MTYLETAKSRILSQFSDSQRFQELLEVLLGPIDDLELVIGQLETLLCLETSEGIWLDVLGEIVGVARPNLVVPPELLFTYKDIGAPDNPLQGFGGIPPGTTFGLYDSLYGLEQDIPAEDPQYRDLIRAKAASTFSSPSLPSIYQFIRSTFNVECHLTEPYAGKVDVTIDTYLSSKDRADLVNNAPVAAGIAIEITNWPLYS